LTNIVVQDTGIDRDKEISEATACQKVNSSRAEAMGELAPSTQDSSVLDIARDRIVCQGFVRHRGTVAGPFVIVETEMARRRQIMVKVPVGVLSPYCWSSLVDLLRFWLAVRAAALRCPY